MNCDYYDDWGCDDYEPIVYYDFYLFHPSSGLTGRDNYYGNFVKGTRHSTRDGIVNLANRVARDKGLRNGAKFALGWHDGFRVFEVNIPDPTPIVKAVKF